MTSIQRMGLRLRCQQVFARRVEVARAASSRRLQSASHHPVIRTAVAVVLTIAVMILIVMPGQPITAAQSDNPELNLQNAAPNADLSPAKVVTIQMQALGKNDQWGQDRGIAVAFRFASPSNRRVTGPLERFIKLVANPTYGVMLNHTGVEIGTARTNEAGDEAQVPVLVSAANDTRAGFVFTLSLQRPDANDDSDFSACECWMTDSVSRVEVPQPPGDSI